MLLRRSEDTYTDDERASVEYLLAFWDEMDDLGPFTEAHRWCRTARKIDVVARRLQRLPTGEDGATRTQIRWIEAQKTAQLNSFQRGRLEAIPGWVW